MSTRNLETTAWRSSTYSQQTGDCVEVADGRPGVLPVRDSKAPDGPYLVFGGDAWGSFVGMVKGGGLPSA